MYNKSTGIEFDLAEDETNRAKHGVSPFEADGIEWERRGRFQMSEGIKQSCEWGVCLHRTKVSLHCI